MAENYREQNQEEAEGIVDAGGFVNDPGTGMVAEDQETAAAADMQPEAPVYAPSYDDEEAIEETEASENVHIDMHEETGSGIDWAVIVIILLVIIGCLSFAYATAPTEEEQKIIALQEALQQASNREHVVPYEVAELPEGVAAVVNGEVIEESAIDEYMAGFRSLYGLQDESDWAAWLISQDYTPEQIRDVAIASYVDDVLVSQAVEEYGIEASQEAIDEIYNTARESFASEEEWQEGLKEAMLTEESYREQCKQQAEKQALREYLGDRWFATPEDEEAEVLVAVKQYYPQYSNVDSLDGISAEELEPVREMVLVYAQSDAYEKFLADAKENGDIKMSAAPDDLPYDANLLMGLFGNLAFQMEMAQEAGQQ